MPFDFMLSFLPPTIRVLFLGVIAVFMVLAIINFIKL